jgi:F-type H+-transporting ATPase subunit delta
MALKDQKNHQALLQHVSNLIMLLAYNKRIILLPDIFAGFEALRAAQEKTAIVTVVTFSALNESQCVTLIERLSQRLQLRVTLDVSIDPSLLGGAVIRCGDFVIDGSVRGKLQKLSTSLAA